MALAVAAWSEEEPNFSAITRSLRLERLGRHCAVDCIGAGRPLDPDLPKMWRASPAHSKVGQGTTEIRTLPRRRSGRVGSVAANLLGFGRRDAAAGGRCLTFSAQAAAGFCRARPLFPCCCLGALPSRSTLVFGGPSPARQNGRRCFGFFEDRADLGTGHSAQLHDVCRLLAAGWCWQLH